MSREEVSLAGRLRSYFEQNALDPCPSQIGLKDSCGVKGCEACWEDALAEAPTAETLRLRAKNERLVADNAALADVLAEIRDAARASLPPSSFSYEQFAERTKDKCSATADKALSQPHPGDPLRTELGRIEEENNLLWAILKTCPGCTRFVPGVVHGCEMQAHIDLSGHCNQREELKGK